MSNDGQLLAGKDENLEKQDMKVDKNTRAQAVLENEHHEIHAGNHFTYCDEVTGLSNGTITNYGLTTGAKFTHLIWSLYADAAVRVEFFKDSTFTVGAVQTAYNNNLNSATAADMAIVKGPTISADGTKICGQRMGTATGQANIANIRENNERILKPNTSYVMRVTSLANSNNADVELSFYQK